LPTDSSASAGSSRRSRTAADKFIWWLVFAGRLVLGAIFVYAAYTKLHNPWMLFGMMVDSYQMLPEWGVELVARALPWLELLLGTMLILGIWARWAAAGATALLAVFIYAIVRAYRMNLGINCGCFGTSEPITKFTILRDTAFLAASFALTMLAFISRRRARQSA
jgi:uncharacterized membrane protein YphA (DoxX/SURF4 family)